MKWFLSSALVFVAFLGGPLAVLTASRVSGGEWWSASREPAGLAPDPKDHAAAIVQVYAARAYSWRGAFGVHTWISVKPTGADTYTVYEVIGWRVRRGEPAVVIHQEAPDRLWYGNQPEIVADIRGDGVDDVIRRIDAAARKYPYRDTYTVWPGPNSNTFIAWVARAAPELKLDLPATAIGKDWLDAGSGQLFARTPSGTGFQFSLFGLFGVLAGVEEGIEVNVIGLTVGVDPLDLAVKLPGIGNVGLGAPRATAAQPEPPAE
jgi:hypothetical protein